MSNKLYYSALILALALFLIPLPFLFARAQGISLLQQFTATTSPERAITQTVFGKPLRLTGQGSGCAQFSSNGTLTSTGSDCGTGSGNLFGKAWEIISGFLMPTTTVPVKINATTTLATTTASMLNGVIVVDGVRYPQNLSGIQGALNDARDRARGECVFLPSATYTISTSTILYSNSCLVGQSAGSTVIVGTGNVPTLRTFKQGTSKTAYTNISIRSLTVKASPAGLGAHIVRLDNIDGLTVEDSHFEHTLTPISGTPESLFIEHARNVKVQGNYVFNTAGNGIQVNGVDYFTIANNLVSSTTDDGIDVDHDFFDTDAVPSRYGTVVGNVIRGVPNGNGIRVENSQMITVTGNQVDSIGGSGILVNSTLSSDPPVRDVVVSANQISNAEVNGISVEGSYTTNTLISGNNIASTSLNTGGQIRAGINVASASTTVTGNTIRDTQKGGGDGGGIVVYRVDDVNISNNHISDTARGINLWNEGFVNDYTGIVATGNTFDSVTTPYYGASGSWQQPGVLVMSILFDSNRTYPKYGIGTTSPGSLFSVSGTVLADSLQLSSTTASSTFANGVNLIGGCFSVRGACLSIGAPYPFALTGNATSTLTQFNAGLTAFASSTIGNGTLGLTVSGNSTTTGKAYFAGLVGIGTASPLAPLHVTNTSEAAITTGLYLKNSTGSPGGIAIDFDNASTDAVRARINTIRTGSTNAPTDLAFSTFNATTVSLNEALRIQSTGNVGVGTTSPYAKLSVAGTVVAASFVGTTSATSTLGGGMDIASGCFAVNGTCLSAGGSSFTYPFPNNATTTGLGLYASTTIGAGGQATGLTVNGGATTTANAFFSSSIGVGVSPGISGDVTATRIVSDTLTSRTNGYVTFSQPVIVGGTVYGSNSSGGSLTIDSTRNSTKGNIILAPTSGNVGIGTTTPFSAFHVTSGASATTTVTIGSIGLASSKGCVNMNRSDGGPGSFYLNASGVMISEPNYCR